MDEHLAERLSAAVDGELQGKDRQRVLDALCRDATLKRRWVGYHCLGEVLRKEPVRLNGDASLAARVRRELEGETVVSAPTGWWTGGRRRHWVPLGGAVAASVAALALIGLPPLDSEPDGAGVAVISQAPADGPTPTTVAAQTAPRATAEQPAASPHLNRYLVNHSHYGVAGVPGTPSAVRIAAQPER